MSERIVQQPVATSVQSKFSDLPTADVERSTFDMSHPWKGTLEAQKIVPCLLQEVLPGDTFNVNTTAFMRLATPLKPLMDSLSCDIHYFFVPNRLVWDNWVNFMGERDNPSDDPTLLSVPQARVNLDINECSQWLQDYWGMPMVDEIEGAEAYVNALPYRGYTLIWNEWYRNENLQNSNIVLKDDGPDDIYDNPFYASPANRCKRGDYFTKSMPWPQKGDPVFLPLGDSAPVIPDAQGVPWFRVDQTDTRFATKPGGDQDGVDFELYSNQGSIEAVSWSVDNPTGLEADLTTATAATINDIRTAFQIQRLLERDARSGTRYIEVLLAHFNVQSPDYRLQRPEYIGGGSARIIVNPVAATVATEDTPQGNLAAVGTGLVKASMNHSFTEHGFLHGFLTCRADATYQNGLDRIWSRQTRYDYYWPALSHLGEQQVLNKELYWSPDDDELNEETWGYQERYAEYRYQPGRITGKFRSADPESLDVWHLAQDFDDLPTLGIPFILENPPIERVVAVPSEPDLIVDVWHNMKATRPMPVYAVPGLVDHF